MKLTQTAGQIVKWLLIKQKEDLNCCFAVELHFKQ